MDKVRALIEAIIKERSLDMAALSRAVGRNHAYIQQYLKRGVPQDLPEKVRAKLAVELKVRERDLMPPDLRRVPDGQEFEPEPEFDPDAGNAASSAEPYKPSLPNARPEIDVKPGAGLGTVGQTFGVNSKGIVTGHRVVAEWVIPPDYMRHELGARPSMIMVMQVIGDSMEPTLKHNDRVLVDISQNVFGPDAVYVIDDGDGEPRVKRLTKNIMSDPPSVSIKSDNPLAEQRVQVLLGAFRIVGRVVGRVTGM